MSFSKFISVAVMGMFVGWIVVTILTEWTNFGDKIIYSACALSGVFAEDILKEFEGLRLKDYAATESEKQRNIWTICYGNTTKWKID